MAAAESLTPKAGLAGRRIVITRPAAQASTLAAAIRRESGIPVLFPVLDIQDLEDPAPLCALADRLDDFDFAVFVSPNAVNKALATILGRRPWPPRVRAVALGKSSERELARFGVHDIIAPRDRFDSEALIALPELAASRVAGKRFIVFRGDGGRELLGDTLTERGAQVEYVECYRRGKPTLDPAPLAMLAARGELSAITVTSSEGLRNLFDMVGEPGHAWLRSTLVFVPHGRIGEEARRLGIERIVLTGPGDEGLLAGLIDHFAVNRKTP